MFYEGIDRQEELSVSIISIPRSLRDKLGDEASESLVEMLNQYSQENRESIIGSATQRYEIHLANEMSHLKTELKADIFDLREEMMRIDHSIRSDLGSEISELRDEMHRNNTNVIKWMFVFWIGQIGALIGVLFAFFA